MCSLKTKMKMKMKIGIIIFYLTIALSVIATGKTKIEHTNITGKIETNWSDQIQLGDTIVSIAEDGTFKFRLIVEKPMFLRLKYEYKNIDLFVVPGKDVKISGKGKKFPSALIFKGCNSDLNTFLLNQEILKMDTYKFLDDNKEFLFSLKPIDYINKIDSIKQFYLSNLNELIKEKDKVSEWFAKITKKDIIFQFARIKLIYPLRFYRYNEENAQLEPDYFTNIAKNAFNDPDFLKIESFQRFVNTYLNIQSAGKYKTTNYLLHPLKSQGSPRYNVIINLMAHQRITDYLLAEEVKSVIGCGVNNIGDLLQRFKEDCKDIDLKNEVLQLYEKHLEHRKEPSEIKVYRMIDNIELEAHIFYPKDFKKTDKRSVYIFFHGGGWYSGNPQWGYDYCRRYAAKGMVAISIEYRLLNLHGVRRVDCVEDAKSAISWTRANAKNLGINSEKIVAAGFSAGAHLSACTAILTEADEGFNKASVCSSQPNVLILESAPYSLKHFSNLNAGEGELISPLSHVKSKLVPTIMFHGTNDYIVSHKEFNSFVKKMKELDNDFIYHSFEGAGHFDLFSEDNDNIKSEMIEKFLIKKGILLE